MTWININETVWTRTECLAQCRDVAMADFSFVWLFIAAFLFNELPMLIIHLKIEPMRRVKLIRGCKIAGYLLNLVAVGWFLILAA